MTPIISTPKYPDPKETANAQAGMNRDTATTQQLINQTNQVTPDGSLTYNQTGTNSFVGADGKTVTIPQFTATTSLSPAQQTIYDRSQAAEGNLAGLAQDQSAKLRGYLNEPFSYSNRDAENWTYDLGAQRLDPRFAREEEALRTRLANQGIHEGTAAYDAAYGNLSQAKNDAYNQLMLSGRQQGFTEALAQRNQPINEITALLSGGQVSMPQFAQTPQTGVGGVDYTSLVNQKYQADLQRSQAAMGGLFGLLSAPFSLMKFSDRRLKSEPVRVGTLDNGIPLYIYTIDGRAEIGVMADEVQQIAPEAVTIHPSGYKQVDYGALYGDRQYH